MVRYNRYIYTRFQKVLDGGIEKFPIFDTTDVLNINLQTYQPLNTSVSFSKDITSKTNTATVSITNASLIEEIYQQGQAFVEELADSHVVCDVIVGDTGSGEEHVAYSGDVVDFSISSSTNDSTITFSLSTGAIAKVKGTVNKPFPAETSYREIVEQCFADSYTDKYAIDLSAILDPEGVLETKLLKPRTFYGPTYDVLDTIGRGIAQDENAQHPGYVWSIDNFEGDRQKAFFIDRRSPVDVFGDGSIKTLSHETGRVGRIGLTRTGFSFLHKPD
ncbi:MAG: hypothetical protein GKR96_04275 [Gammaproteobacteria bacterium]|nr:hypothetical protein [Gammaproteobacteria bacterium]